MTSERSTVRRASLDLLESHFDDTFGYTVPSPLTYGPQWLWDSAYHAICWGHLGREERAYGELSVSLDSQHPDGFVPHMRYPKPFAGLDPVGLWGRSDASILTQPPVYAHAIAHLASRGSRPPGGLATRARRGIEFLTGTRPRLDGLVTVVHPWETGCDDSARFDGWRPGGGGAGAWQRRKVELVATVRCNSYGSPVANPEFEVGSVGFNSLIAFSMRDLGSLTSDGDLAHGAAEIVDALEGRWNGETWADAGPHASTSAPTLDGLLPLLVVRDERQAKTVFDQLLDPSAFAGRYGLRYVRTDHATYDPQGYWRGSSWMPMQYLMLLAARRFGRDDLAERIRAGSCEAALLSGFAEHYDPDTGEGCGAIPHSWAALATVIADC